VKRIYAVVGDSLNGLTDAIRQGKIEWVHMRHEEAGAYAAGADTQKFCPGGFQNSIFFYSTYVKLLHGYQK